MLTQTRISDGQITSYTWDFGNRLTEVLVKSSGGTTVQDDKFTYDIENRRIGKSTLNGGQGWTAYVDQNPYADFNSSGSLTYWHMYGVTIDSLLGRVDSSGNAMWYLTDKLGSVRENVDANGNVLDSITYDTFGNIIAETHPTSGDRFKYTGREWDSEIGQYFYRARYYSPTDGRLVQEDHLGFLGGDANLYRYVYNGPTNGTDPNLGTTPTKVEKLKERMRQKQGFPPTKAAATTTSTVLTAPPPPATVKHACGHEVPFREIAKDKFRNERYQKELKRPCPTCREANKEANEEAGRKIHEEKQAKKKLSFKKYTDPGTGVGYSFIFHHLGVGQWEYSLVKMSSSQEVGKGTCKNLRMALGAMNEILAKLEKQEATPGLTP